MGVMPVSYIADVNRIIAAPALSGSGDGTSGAAVATINAGGAGTYDVSANNVLNIFICNNHLEETKTWFQFTIENVGVTAVDAAAATAAEIAAAVNAHPAAAKYFTGVDNSGTFRITTKQKGTSVAIYVTGSANTPLAFTQVAPAGAEAATGVAAKRTITVTDFNNVGQRFVPVQLTLYAADSGGTKDTTAVIQQKLNYKGNVVSDYNTNTVETVTDERGIIEFDIIDSGADAQTAFLDVLVRPSNTTLPARESITTGSE